MEEVNGATVVNHPHLGFKPCQKELGHKESSSSGPEYPPRFENSLEVVRPSNQTIMQTMHEKVVTMRMTWRKE